MGIREGAPPRRVAPRATPLTEWPQSTLSHPDERQLAKGIKSTDVPKHLKNMVDLLVSESNQTEEGGTGVCLEYLLKNGAPFGNPSAIPARIPLYPCRCNGSARQTERTGPTVRHPSRSLALSSKHGCTP